MKLPELEYIALLFSPMRLGNDMTGRENYVARLSDSYARKYKLIKVKNLVLSTKKDKASNGIRGRAILSQIERCRNKKGATK